MIGKVQALDILYMSNSKTRLWLVFTLFSLLLLAEHFVQFGMPIGKLARRPALPECASHFRSDSSEHYFLDCFLYAPERQTLLSLVEHYVPDFSRLTKKNKLDLLLRGVNPDNNEFLPTNTILTKAVQTFILQTRRFVKIEIEE